MQACKQLRNIYTVRPSHVSLAYTYWSLHHGTWSIKRQSHANTCSEGVRLSVQNMRRGSDIECASPVQSESESEGYSEGCETQCHWWGYQVDVFCRMHSTVARRWNLLSSQGWGSAEQIFITVPDASFIGGAAFSVMCCVGGVVGPAGWPRGRSAQMTQICAMIIHEASAWVAMRRKQKPRGLMAENFLRNWPPRVGDNPVGRVSPFATTPRPSSHVGCLLCS